MALKIPIDFDVNTQDLDPSEKFIRDQLRLKIDNWAKFRHTIIIGIDAAKLQPIGGIIPDNVKEAYRELGKSHYEVITSLGSARLSFDSAVQVCQSDPLMFKKSFKDFYFHIGCLLDNLARLIYIVNDPQSANATYKNGKRKGKLIRHWIDWGELSAYPGYSRLKHSKNLKEIMNVRNVFTHGWSCPIFRDKTTGVLRWPFAVRTRRDFYWPYDELGVMKQHYRKLILLLETMEKDLAFIEGFQNEVFAKLVRDVKKFERNHSLVICQE